MDQSSEQKLKGCKSKGGHGVMTTTSRINDCSLALEAQRSAASSTGVMSRGTRNLEVFMNTHPTISPSCVVDCAECGVVELL